MANSKGDSTISKGDSTAANWDNSVNDYIDTVARVTTEAAPKFVDMITSSFDIPSVKYPKRILDSGAGIGSLTLEFAKTFPGVEVLATDISPGMLKAISDRNLPNVTTQILDSSVYDPPKGSEGRLEDNSFDIVGTTFMLQFLKPEIGLLACKEFARVTKPGGVVAIGIWGPRILFQIIFNRAAKAIDPNYEDRQFFGPDAWYTAEDCAEALTHAGLKDIKSKTIPVKVDWFNAGNYSKHSRFMSNPGMQKMRDSYKGEKADEVWKEFERIALEEYDDAKETFIDVSFAVGIKK